MGKAYINQFNGGLAQDNRTFSTNQYAEAVNLDMLTYGHYLAPYKDTTNETMVSGTIDDHRITDVSTLVTSGSTYIIGLGRNNSGSNSPKFFKKDSTTSVTASWQSYATGANSVVAGTLQTYKGKGYCLGDTTSAHNLQEWDGASSVSTVGTLTGYGTNPPRPFEHPEDKILYMASGNVVSKYDGSSFTATALTLPTDKIITSLTNYGTYLVIICKPKNGSGNSTMYFWGRSTTLTTLQAVFDLGVGDALVVENLENQLFIVMATNTVGNYTTSSTKYLIVKTYSGGSTPILTKIPISSSVTTNNLKMKIEDELYFGFSNDTALYRIGKNKDGVFSLNRDVAIPEANATIAGISRVGDLYWLSYVVSGTYKLKRTLSEAETASYATVSSFTTTYNPSMALEDRYKKKQLTAVQVSFTGASSGTATLYLSVDGATMKSCLSSTLTGERMVSTTKFTDGTVFPEGSEFQFKFTSTGNVKLKEIRYRYTLTNDQFA